jgi:RHS repeat-associated protein
MIIKKLILSFLLVSSIAYAKQEGTIKILDPKVTISQGKSNYSLNIQTPTSIGKVNANLSIKYFSQDGNDILGLDTSLDGIPKITRCSSTPYFDNNDKFCLDNESLVKVKDSTNEYLLKENPSTKFTKHDNHWEMFTSDGNKYIFGNTDNSKISISHTEKQYYDNNIIKNKTEESIVQWNITKQTDTNNNVVNYTYTVVNKVPYISLIEYDHNEIKFNYESRLDSADLKHKFKKGLVTTFTSSDNRRKDTMQYPSEYNKQTQRLEKIIVKQNNILSHSYKFNYDYGNKNHLNIQKSRLKEISYCDSLNKCLNPAILNYKEYLDVASNQVIDNDPTRPQQLDLLDNIINNFGVTKTIAYEFLDNNDINKEDNIYNVSSLSIKMPDNGYKILTYNYEDHKYIEEEHNYSKVTIHDNLTDIKTITQYSQEIKSLNKKTVETKQIGNTVLNETTFDYETILEPNSNENRTHLDIKTTKDYDLKGKFLSTTVVDYDYDEFENIKKTTTTITGNGTSYTRIKDIDYLEDKVNWILNKPNLITVTNQLNNEPSLTLVTKFEYFNNTTRNLEHKTIALGTKDELKTSYMYKDNGLIESLTIGERTSSIQYDDFYRIFSKTNAKNQITKYKYDDPTCFNKTTSITNINNLTTTFEYDSLCNIVKQTEANGRITNTKYDATDQKIDLGLDYQNIGFDSYNGLKSIYSITKSTNTGHWNKTYHNIFGEVIRTVKLGFESKKIYKDIIYNDKGLIKAKAKPYFKGDILDIVNYVQYEYDNLNRLTKKILPKEGGEIITINKYDGLKTTITNPNNNIKTIQKDILGNVKKVSENNSIIKYAYDSNMNLIQTDTNNKIITMKYDILNRKTFMKDPSTGEISYIYNKYGNLIKQTNNEGEITITQYDDLGREVSKTQNGNVSTYEYDKAVNGIGMLNYTSNANTNTTYAYDIHGRLYSTTKVIDTKSFYTVYTYNKNNQIINTQYPNNLNIINKYDSATLLKNISIPNPDVWDFDYVSLENNYIKLINEIEGLLQQIIEYEDKAKKYTDEAKKYRNLGNKYREYSDKYKNEATKLLNLAKAFQKQADAANLLADQFRQKARNYLKLYGDKIVRYINTSNNIAYFKNDDCTKKDWKGRCKRRNNIALPSWMTTINGVQQKTINLADTYNRLANEQENIANQLEIKIAEHKVAASKLNGNAADAYKAIKIPIIIMLDGITVVFYIERTVLSLQASAQSYKVASEVYYAKAKKYFQLAKDMIITQDSIVTELEGLKNSYEEQSENYDEELKYRKNDTTKASIYSINNRDAFNRVSTQWFGNGLITTTSFDPTTNRVKRIETKGIRDINYVYDDMNNVKSRTDNYTGQNEVFTYDEYDRLKTWTNNTSELIYNYDIYGNQKNNYYNESMHYNNSNQITSKVNKNNQHYSYTYDDNGNILSDGIKSYTYTSFNKVLTITKDNVVTTFKYDSFNNLVSKSKGTTSTYYVDKEYEVSETLTVEGSHIIVKKEIKHNIYAQNELVVTHTKTTIDNIKEVDITAYIHKDSLGSVDTVTNAKGEVILRNRYTPFGGLLSSSSPTPSRITKETLKGYTSHEQYYDLELINMGGRMYDPTISRFLSIDPLLQDPFNSQNFNRYSYVMNNPLKYIDPSGYSYDDEHSPDEDGFDSSQSDYDAGAASDNQANENHSDGDGNRGSGYNRKGDGDYKAEKEKAIARVDGISVSNFVSGVASIFTGLKNFGDT